MENAKSERPRNAFLIRVKGNHYWSKSICSAIMIRVMLDIKYGSQLLQKSGGF